jgi:long-subunit acyl-CoA synthetase (AMP-forming)
VKGGTRLGRRDGALGRASIRACATGKRNVAQFGSKPAYREKEYGIWQSWTWAETAEEIQSIAYGFLALGR